MAEPRELRTHTRDPVNRRESACGRPIAFESVYPEAADRPGDWVAETNLADPAELAASRNPCLICTRAEKARLKPKRKTGRLHARSAGGLLETACGRPIIDWPNIGGGPGWISGAVQESALTENIGTAENACRACRAIKAGTHGRKRNPAGTIDPEPDRGPEAAP